VKLKRQNGIFELTLTLFTVILLLLGATVWGILPEIKSYLQVQEQMQADTLNTVRLQTEYDRLYAQKETMEADAAALAEQFENSADAVSLLGWLKSAWPDTEVSVDTDGAAFRVRAGVKTPTAFYRFVERLDTAPWVLSLDAPIAMQADKGGIIVTFLLRPLTRSAEPSPLQK